METLCYISGPTGPQYASAAATLRSRGFGVIDPVELEDAQSWNERARLSMKRLLECDSVVVLPHEPELTLTELEIAIAEALDMCVSYWDAA